MSRQKLLCAVVMLLGYTLPCVAQSTTMQIRLSYADGAAPAAPQGTAGVDSSIHGSGTKDVARGDMTTMQIRVELLDQYGTVLFETKPDPTGRVTITMTQGRPGESNRISSDYRLRITGPDIEEINLEGVDPVHGDRMLDIVLHRKGERDVRNTTKETSVALSRLKIPDKARKEVDHGNENLLSLPPNLPEAEKHFRKAIELFPDYDQAHNNLGVVLMQTNRTAEARKEFEKAVVANDKFSRAYVNLGKLDLMEKKYPESDVELRKAVQADPRNAEALMLAAESAMFTGKYEDAIADAKLVHSMPHENYGLAHFFAGHAYIALNKNAEAIQEFTLFIKESPTSPNVPNAKMSIAKLQAHE